MLVPSSDFPTKKPQPVKVAPADTLSMVDAQVVDDAASPRFTWTIDNFSRLNVKNYSDVFDIGGYKWRILIFPKGNNVDYLSIFLDVADAATLPTGWSRHAKFSLAVVDQIHGKFTLRRVTEHLFTAEESDRGFAMFLPPTELNDPGKGFLVDDKVIIEANITFPKVH